MKIEWSAKVYFVPLYNESFSFSLVVFFSVFSVLLFNSAVFMIYIDYTRVRLLLGSYIRVFVILCLSPLRFFFLFTYELISI